MQKHAENLELFSLICIADDAGTICTSREEISFKTQGSIVDNRNVVAFTAYTDFSINGSLNLALYKTENDEPIIISMPHTSSTIKAGEILHFDIGRFAFHIDQRPT